MALTAGEFKKKWQHKWPNIDLANIRDYDKNRWVRFHTLPNSKRYPEDSSELEQILTKHNMLLQELHPGPSICIVITHWLTHESELKRIDLNQKIGDFEVVWETDNINVKESTVSQISWQNPALNDLLIAVTNDQLANVILAPENLEWLYHPYDGGVDIVVSSVEQRDSLRSKYRSWLSSRSDGL